MQIIYHGEVLRSAWHLDKMELLVQQIADHLELTNGAQRYCLEEYRPNKLWITVNRDSRSPQIIVQHDDTYLCTLFLNYEESADGKHHVWTCSHMHPEHYVWSTVLKMTLARIEVIENYYASAGSDLPELLPVCSTTKLSL